MTPKSYFDSIWDRCAQLKRAHSVLVAGGGNQLLCDEILRAEWAMRVSALDLYVHEVVAQAAIQIFRNRRARCVGFERQVLSLGNYLSIRSRRTADERASRFDLAFREKISRMTFQFPEDIADGIRMVSSAELWNEIAFRRGATARNVNKEAKRLKQELSAIVDRRNKIVHEGDLEPNFPRQPWPITRAHVDAVETYIEETVLVMEHII